MNTMDEFISLLASELAITDEEIKKDSNFRELRNWSSLNALLIMSKIHEEMNVLIAPSDLATVTTVEELFELTK